MNLTNTSCKNAKPKEKFYRLSDGQGLYLQVQPSGSKYWRLKYQFAGKEKCLALGVYPLISLAEARARREQARKQLSNGIDPSQAKQEEKRLTILNGENTFEVLAREWSESRKLGLTERHANYVLGRLENDVFPVIGNRPVTAITPPELLHAIRAIEKRGAYEIAHRVLQSCAQIFRYGIATGRVTYNPTADLRGALKTSKQGHYAALKAEELPEFLRKLSSNEAGLYKQTQLAIRLLILTFVRTGELIGAKWPEFNLEDQEWRVPAERMKMKEEHIVPLAHQAISVLKELKELNGERQWIFPNQANPQKPMSNNTILFAIYRMGYHSRATGHGFRATASTVLNENGFRPDVIERQLAHAERNQIRAAYNRAQYLPERRKMMQHWADYLDAKARGGKVITAKFGK